MNKETFIIYSRAYFHFYSNYTIYVSIKNISLDVSGHIGYNKYLANKYYVNISPQKENTNWFPILRSYSLKALIFTLTFVYDIESWFANSLLGHFMYTIHNTHRHIVI